MAVSGPNYFGPPTASRLILAAAGLGFGPLGPGLGFGPLGPGLGLGSDFEPPTLGLGPLLGPPALGFGPPGPAQNVGVGTDRVGSMFMCDLLREMCDDAGTIASFAKARNEERSERTLRDGHASQRRRRSAGPSEGSASRLSRRITASSSIL